MALRQGQAGPRRLLSTFGGGIWQAEPLRGSKCLVYALCFNVFCAFWVEVDAVDPENWPELKENPTDSEGNVIEEQRKWSMPLPGQLSEAFSDCESGLGPWRHGSVKGFLRNYVTEQKHYPDCGSSDAQVDGVAKVAPVVALLAGQKELLATVDMAVRVVQNTDKSAAFACGFARVLEKVILGSKVNEARSWLGQGARSRR